MLASRRATNLATHLPFLMVADSYLLVSASLVCQSLSIYTETFSLFYMLVYQYSFDAVLYGNLLPVVSVFLRNPLLRILFALISTAFDHCRLTGKSDCKNGRIRSGSRIDQAIKCSGSDRIQIHNLFFVCTAMSSPFPEVFNIKTC